MEDDAQLFNITQKLHFLLHSAMLAKFINPRRVWCFQGEDSMRHFQHLAKSCTKGLNSAGAGLKMVQHLRLAMHLKFLEHSK